MGKRSSQASVETLDFEELEQLQDKADKPLGVAYMVGRLERALRRNIRQLLAPMGLTISQYTALSVFYGSGGLSNAKLAERTMVSPQAANELIKGMEKNGWIVRKPDPNHGRIIQINLTKDGIQLLFQCNKLVAEMERKMLRSLNKKEINNLHGQLRNAVGALREL
jgi:DNA-binding MarR family transcriptional regulator